ncbi:MAG: hypothetical protein UR26_C0003G0129 [candidate division TM6 bacterium GW2011_GWF2_32_72]|nr:MAG: hypothetical protein UR26_C0003G0129 [candidate division TM6 bacterium GW2011_GWF2_32_72]
MKLSKIVVKSNEVLNLNLEVFENTEFILELDSNAVVEGRINFVGMENLNFKFICKVLGLNAKLDLVGLYDLKKNESLNVDLIQVHSAKNSKSSVIFKGILQDQAQIKFNGCMDVQKNCSGCELVQSNKNLLVNGGKAICSCPSMKILTKDVKCSHSIEIGQIDEEQLFFLQCRGLNDEKANDVLKKSFLF